MEITTKLGKHQIKVQGENLKSCMEQLGLIGELADVCPVCGSQNAFYHKVTKDDDTYYGLRCTGQQDENGERHELTFGQNKKGDTLFLSWKARWRIVGTGKLARGQKAAEDNNSGGGHGDDEDHGQDRRGNGNGGGNRQQQSSGRGNGGGRRADEDEFS